MLFFSICEKGKEIPEDAPEYFKKALLRAKKAFKKGIILEKSGLVNFNEKYTIEGEPGLIPWDYFGKKAEKIKYFFKKIQKN